MGEDAPRLPLSPVVGYALLYPLLVEAARRVGYAIALRDHIDQLTRERDQARAELVAARVAALREGFEIAERWAMPARPVHVAFVQAAKKLERRIAEIESEGSRG